MKAYKLFLVTLAFISRMSFGVMTHHTNILVTEHKIIGHTFKHIITSGNAEKDEFFIDGTATGKLMYDKELERWLKIEREEELARQEQERRSRIEFLDSVQIDIMVKLLDKLVIQSQKYLAQIYNPALEKFYCFTDQTIDSLDQLYQLKLFIDQIKLAAQKRVDNYDIEGLHSLYSKLEPWPVRLEHFFQDTIARAIAQSDDTAMLKDLLRFVGDAAAYQG